MFTTAASLAQTLVGARTVWGDGSASHPVKLFAIAASILRALAAPAGCGGGGQGDGGPGPPPPPPPPDPIPIATFSLLHTFAGTDGANPSGLIRDSAGNLYGTTQTGGDLACADSPVGCGTVFKIDTGGILTTLYVFAGSPNDGAGPQPELILDESGNLYGATFAGGSHQAGTVFKLDVNGNETVLYDFTGEEDGAGPELGVRDEDGNLYGSTYGPFLTACSAACGAVFRLAVDGTLTVLHAFSGSDGMSPSGRLVRDGSGTLFGTTEYGGNNPACVSQFGCGTVYKINVNGAHTLLHAFVGSIEEGETPTGGLLLEADGSLFGTTLGGGSGLGGTVYELEPNGNLIEILAFFGGDGGEVEDDPGGKTPEGGVVRGVAGNLYGTTRAAGRRRAGVLFEVDTETFEERVLYTFSPEEGGLPVAPLVVDGDGNLYGTGLRGEDLSCEGGCGIAFKVAMQLP